MNFFDGHISPDGTLVFANEQKIKHSAATMANFDMDKIGNGLDVIFGVRPGDLRVVTEPNALTVSAKVEVIEALGNETIIYANMDKNAASGIEKTPTSITASAKLKKNPVRNSEILLSIDEEAIHLFEKETQVSIRK